MAKNWSISCLQFSWASGVAPGPGGFRRSACAAVKAPAALMRPKSRRRCTCLTLLEGSCPLGGSLTALDWAGGALWSCRRFCHSCGGETRLCSPSFLPAWVAGLPGTWGGVSPACVASIASRRLPRRRRGLLDEAELEVSRSEWPTIVDEENDHRPLPGAPTVVESTDGV